MAKPKNAQLTFQVGDKVSIHIEGSKPKNYLINLVSTERQINLMPCDPKNYKRVEIKKQNNN